MGKVLDNYLKQYFEGLRATWNPESKQAIRPEAWIAFKYTDDEAIEPWDPDFDLRMNELERIDPAMALMVRCGITVFKEEPPALHKLYL